VTNQKHEYALALDLETTGLDPQKHQILEIGAVLVDATDRRIVEGFETAVFHEEVRGQPYALSMNHKLLARPDDEKVPLSRAMYDFTKWLRRVLPEGTFAYPLGFNVGPFDLAFLKTASISFDPLVYLHRRCIELGTLYSDKGIPQSSKKVVPRFLNREVAHTALQDATDAAALYLKALDDLADA